MRAKTAKKRKFKARAAERLLSIDKGRKAYSDLFARAGVEIRPLTPAEKKYVKIESTEDYKL